MARLVNDRCKIKQNVRCLDATVAIPMPVGVLGGTRMKQHLAKSLLMAGAMIASYPLFAQQAQPIQPTQPMPATQSMQPAQPMPSAQPMQAMPAAAPSAQGTPAAGSYAQAPVPAAQPGMAPAPV